MRSVKGLWGRRILIYWVCLPIPGGLGVRRRKKALGGDFPLLHAINRLADKCGGEAPYPGVVEPPETQERFGFCGRSFKARREDLGLIPGAVAADGSDEADASEEGRFRKQLW